MCGIVGIFSPEPAQDIYDSLIYLQHRGQDAAGIITCDEGFHEVKGLGLVKDIFNESNMTSLKGYMGIGHTRYPTAGNYGKKDIQPFWLSMPYGIALAHNGNLINVSKLIHHIHHKRHRFLNTTSDSEIILHILSDELYNALNQESSFFDKLCVSVKNLYHYVKGAYSLVTMIANKGLLVFRDQYGFRPLAWGVRQNNGKEEHIFASETSMFYALGFKLKRTVSPGEIIFIDKKGHVHNRQLVDNKLQPCVFEYVYLSRPDSINNNVNIYRSRLRMGQNLGRLWKEKYPDVLPDVVIPAPSTANTAALSMAAELGVRYTEGIYKNSFIGRTFIMQGQSQRRRSIRYKLVPQELEIRGKKVMIVDDSIVRGHTSREIVKMIRDYGAKEVYFCSASPPISYPCYYGIDIPIQSELIASKRSEEEIRKHLNVEILLYQTQDGLKEAVTRHFDDNIKDLCMACMDGKYPTGKVNQSYMDKMARERQKEYARNGD